MRMTQDTPIRPTPERERQGGILKTDPARDRTPKPWFAIESSISQYLADGTITRRQAEAGYQFQACYYVACGHPVRAQSYEPAIRGSTDHVTDQQLGARAKLQNYRNAHGPDIYDCLVAIAGLGETHSVWARNKGDHPSAGKPIMRIALSKHADLLKLPED